MLRCKFQSPELVNLLCLDTPQHRRPVTNRRLLVTARHRHRDMARARGTIISIGSIANDLSIGSTKFASAWSTPLTTKIANDWSIACTKSMRNVSSSVGIIE